MARALMFLGTSSESGKSLMAAAFCRILHRRGVSVAPFKSQNMALNSGVTADGLEMGRAQIVQAEAAGIEPHVDMNPVLLKPNSDLGSQVVVRGVVLDTMEAARYYREKHKLWPLITESYDRLAARYGSIVLEGAGSPVEMNLKKHDIVNTAMARYAGARTVLVADIDRGGVFASIIGTVGLLEPDERQQLLGFIINKFRGDAALLREGYAFIQEKTGLPVLGVVPYMRDLYIPGEDSVALDGKRAPAAVDTLCTVGVVRLPHMANYTDFDPLECDPRFSLVYIASPAQIEECDAVILPGSKNVFYDFRFLVDRGFADRLAAYCSAGGRLTGICGGLQMLGLTVSDPHGVEDTGGSMRGLGLLPVHSVLQPAKVTRRVTAHIGLPGRTGAVEVAGYEIHMGETSAADEAGVHRLPRGRADEPPLGFSALNGRVWGTYLHGLFEADGMRDAFLQWSTDTMSAEQPSFSYRRFKETNYDILAGTVEKNVDVGYILRHTGIE